MHKPTRMLASTKPTGMAMGRVSSRKGVKMACSNRSHGHGEQWGPDYIMHLPADMAHQGGSPAAGPCMWAVELCLRAVGLRLSGAPLKLVEAL